MIKRPQINGLIFLLLLFSAMTSAAQTSHTVSGQILDTTANVRLINTSISLLNAKDSTLRTFTRSNAEGLFTIKTPAAGKYILLVTYPGYADYVEHFTL